jgi:two-component system CheB/CheR fusion protein
MALFYSITLYLIRLPQSMSVKNDNLTENNHINKAEHTAKETSAAASQQKGKAFPVIGMGGSAGSFPSFEKFFTHMPANSGMAFIIVMHLDPNHKGQIADLIQNYTAMPVTEAADGVAVQADHVYIIPPNKDMGIHNRKILLLTPSKPDSHRLPIDYFFQSLADDQWNHAVGIIFSGMGSDGETGIRMIKEKLGMSMVQDPETAQYDSMQLASIGTNLADYVLSPEEMPIKLIQYMNHPVLAEEATEQVRSEIRNSNSIQKILMLLRSHTGHDFSLYKKSTIVRRIDRRIAFHQQPDYVHYVNYLRENPLEIDVLFNELLIGVTKFFRDAQAFESLKSKLLSLIETKKSTEPIRVWIAGCSTGEEAYSVAMLLIECTEKILERKAPKIQIFATDLDAEAIEHGRSGVYRDNIVADVSEERIERFFVKKDGFYTVKKELREMIVFAQHNLIKDAPFTRLDLLCCRNVMIYLNTELQKKIMPIFHYSLNPAGIMFMGPAETIGGFTDMFLPIDPKWKIFQRKQGNVSLNKMIDFPFNVARQTPNNIKMADTERTGNKRTVGDTFNRILLENFTPTSVLINDKGDILYSNGKTGKYLELPSGEAVMNIHKMVREELRYVLGNVIHQARAQKQLATIGDIKLKDIDQTHIIELKAAPLEEAGLQGLILVLFEDKGLYKVTGRQTSKNAEGQNNAISEMEKELVYTKLQLHSTIEQMETSLEELKSTNEELQSTNEELQSTNEESLTTKEEMQSLNEELMTVNIQYQSKAEELTRLNNDMKNLLDATEIGTVFLDNNLNILRYTPQIGKLFNIIPADVGRPISHIVSNFDYSLIEDHIKEVIDKLSIKEQEIRTKNNQWYKVRIMPYRTLDNFISGAVLTFNLITSYKRMEYKLNAVYNYAATLIDAIGSPALQLDHTMQVLTVNRHFLQQFDVKEREIKGSLFINFVHRNWQTDQLDKLLHDCQYIESGATVQLKIGDIKSSFEFKAKPFVDEDTSETLFMMIIIQKL